MSSEKALLGSSLAAAQADLQLLHDNRPGGFPAILLWRKEVDAAERRIAELESQVVVANQALAHPQRAIEQSDRPATGCAARVTALDEPIANQLIEVEAANGAVAAAGALLEELREREPRVSEALRASNVFATLPQRARQRLSRRTLSVLRLSALDALAMTPAGSNPPSFLHGAPLLAPRHCDDGNRIGLTGPHGQAISDCASSKRPAPERASATPHLSRSTSPGENPSTCECVNSWSDPTGNRGKVNLAMPVALVARRAA
jgi:uncharacterized coiled-coil protein SlyX